MSPPPPKALSAVPPSKLSLGLITDPVLTSSELSERLEFCENHGVSIAFWKIPIPEAYYEALSKKK